MFSRQAHAFFHPDLHTVLFSFGDGKAFIVDRDYKQWFFCFTCSDNAVKKVFGPFFLNDGYGLIQRHTNCMVSSCWNYVWSMANCAVNPKFSQKLVPANRNHFYTHKRRKTLTTFGARSFRIAFYSS